jgi:hypothetical protein
MMPAAVAAGAPERPDPGEIDIHEQDLRLDGGKIGQRFADFCHVASI